jgi:hypothetical protein
MEGLRIIEMIVEATGLPGFLVAWENENGDRTYMDRGPGEGSPSFKSWPHSLWGYFATKADAEKAINDAGLADRVLPSDMKA